jgi:hypothetical protein
MRDVCVYACANVSFERVLRATRASRTCVEYCGSSRVIAPLFGAKY